MFVIRLRVNFVSRNGACGRRDGFQRSTVSLQIISTGMQVRRERAYIDGCTCWARRSVLLLTSKWLHVRESLFLLKQSNKTAYKMSYKYVSKWYNCPIDSKMRLYNVLPPCHLLMGRGYTFLNTKSSLQPLKYGRSLNNCTIKFFWKADSNFLLNKTLEQPY